MSITDRLIGRRPLFLSAVCYLTGTAAGGSAYARPEIWGAFLLACALLFALRRRAVWLMAALIFAGALFSAALSLPNAAPLPERALVSGRVEAVDRAELQGDGTLFQTVTLGDAALDGARADGRVRANLYGAEALAVGDGLRFVGKLSRPKSLDNPGGFDFARWAARRGVSVCASGGEDALRAAGAYAPAELTERARRFVSGRFDQLYGSDAPLVKSLVLGDKAELGEEERRLFRDAGAAHLMAVSGLHLSFLVFALSAVLGLFRLGRRCRFLVTALFTLLYLFLTGFPPSALRAAVMALLLLSAPLAGRPYDPLTGLAAAFLLLSAFAPAAVFDAGFQLSFAAVLGILTFGRTLTEPLARIPSRLLRRPAEALAVGVSATLGSLPLMANRFGAIAPYAPLSGLLMIPVAALLLPAALISLIAPLFCPLVRALLNALRALSGFFAALPLARLEIPGWPFYLVAAQFLLCVAASPLTRLPARARRLLTLSPLLLCLLSFGISALSVPQGLRLEILDAGQADAAVIWAEGKLYLSDLGGASSPLPDRLIRAGRPVEAAFLSHPHEDHAGGLDELLDTRRITDLYLPYCWDEAGGDAAAYAAVEKARAGGTKIHYLAAGDELRLSENVYLRVLAPARGARPPAGNAASLCLELRYFSATALLMGDLPADAEPSALPDADFVKAAHHGANDATSERLLETASPAALGISVGRNSFGHPGERVLREAGENGARVFRTDENGCLCADLRRDGTVEVQTQK